ncbi:hypothetical protein B566_EDAN006336, partial [Ephemera danica]
MSLQVGCLCFILLCYFLAASANVCVFNGTPNISEPYQCQMSCGTKGDRNVKCV